MKKVIALALLLCLISVSACAEIIIPRKIVIDPGFWDSYKEYNDGSKMAVIEIAKGEKLSITRYKTKKYGSMTTASIELNENVDVELEDLVFIIGRIPYAVAYSSDTLYSSHYFYTASKNDEYSAYAEFGMDNQLYSFESSREHEDFYYCYNTIPSYRMDNDTRIDLDPNKLYKIWDGNDTLSIEETTDWSDVLVLPPLPATFVDEYHLTAPKSGLNLDDDGVYRMYTNGELDTFTYGIVNYNGGRFFVANGKIIDNSGLVSDGTSWYYLANGQVVDCTGLALYDGAWFYVANGVLDTTKAGLVSYDGRDFMVAAGRILTEANGLIQDPVSGDWYYVAGGQVADYRGLVLYDGVWCYVWDGKFLSDAEGYVEHDGATFYVVGGQVQP